MSVLLYYEGERRRGNSTSFVSFVRLLVESSRRRFGVNDIFFVSTLSSLKNESVFRTVPFLDLLTKLSAETELVKTRKEMDMNMYLVFQASHH